MVGFGTALCWAGRFAFVVDTPPFAIFSEKCVVIPSKHEYALLVWAVRPNARRRSGEGQFCLRWRDSRRGAGWRPEKGQGVAQRQSQSGFGHGGHRRDAFAHGGG